MPEPSSGLEAAALSRINRNLLWIALAAAIGSYFWKGQAWAVSFAIGALGSWLNFKFFESVAGAIGTDGRRPARGSTALLGLKLLMLGMLVFVILKVSTVDLAAVLSGLLIMVPAVVLELVYQLIYARI